MKKLSLVIVLSMIVSINALADQAAPASTVTVKKYVPDSQKLKDAVSLVIDQQSSAIDPTTQSQTSNDNLDMNWTIAGEVALFIAGATTAGSISATKSGNYRVGIPLFLVSIAAGAATGYALLPSNPSSTTTPGTATKKRS